MCCHMSTLDVAPRPGSLREAWEKFDDQIREQASTGWARLRRVHREPVAFAVMLAWIVGIVGDAATTVYMLHHSGGALVEGNPAARAVMDALGPVGWAVAASLVCAALIAPSLGTARGMYARSFRIAALAICAGKVWFAVTNYLLWLQFTA